MLSWDPGDARAARSRARVRCSLVWEDDQFGRGSPQALHAPRLPADSAAATGDSQTHSCARGPASQLKPAALLSR